MPFAVFWQQVSEVIETNQVDRLVIDLRDNPGGNSGIFQPYLESIRRTPRFNQRGRLFVLMNNGTASSAMIHANSFQLFTQAILIGEPTGGRPNSYGELGRFNLPNSEWLNKC
ncbi:MAG: S41 family peptidase [Blastocatellia bacterium]